MCGIAGIVALNGFDPQVLVEMTHLVTHRGPNGFGFAFSEPGTKSRVELIHNENRMPLSTRPVIGLGNRRLSILDVSPLGSMPMEIGDGELAITYNGEIYNYREIRQELERDGHRFRTGTDTEVILHAYQEWGEECLQRFNGMWSFAIWDRTRQQLFCARDRFGVKPFYYALWDGRFCFGSEIKQVQLATKMPRRANAQVVFALLEWGLMDHSAETFFDGIRQLPAGHCLSLGLSNPLTPVIKQYWELQVEPQVKLSPEEATEEFRERFKNAVKIRLRSDVPVGVCLSGGLDSSSILCQAKEIAPDKQFSTFSACFEDRGIDEREYMMAAASATGSVSHSIYPNGHEFWESVQAMVFHHDEPIGAPSAFSQWSVMRRAREAGTPVVLGGQGSDEALCGYQKYPYFYFWHLLRAGNLKLIREMMMWARNGTRRHGQLAGATRYLPGALRRAFSPAQRLCNREFRRSVAFAGAKLGAAKTIAERQKIDLTYTSIPPLLRHEDRNSMAHSVETRHPFLDYQLVEFAIRCPPDLKLRDGWSKWLLRNAMRDILPEKVRLRKTKLGFDAPDANWMRLGLQNGQRELWDTRTLRMERFIDAKSLAHECRQFLAQRPSSMQAGYLFLAISLELWARVQNVS